MPDKGTFCFHQTYKVLFFFSTPDLQVCTSTHFKDGGTQSEWRIKPLKVTNQVSGKADTGSMVFPLCHASSPSRKLKFNSETWTESTGHSQCQGLGVTVAGCRLPWDSVTSSCVLKCFKGPFCLNDSSMSTRAIISSCVRSGRLFSPRPSAVTVTMSGGAQRTMNEVPSEHLRGAAQKMCRAI